MPIEMHDVSWCHKLCSGFIYLHHLASFNREKDTATQQKTRKKIQSKVNSGTFSSWATLWPAWACRMKATHLPSLADGTSSNVFHCLSLGAPQSPWIRRNICRYLFFVLFLCSTNSVKIMYWPHLQKRLGSAWEPLPLPQRSLVVLEMIIVRGRSDHFLIIPKSAETHRARETNQHSTKLIWTING